MVAQARVNVRETMRSKNNCKLDFFSMYFVRNNEETHFLLRIVKNTGHKLQKCYFPSNKLDSNIRSFSSEGMFCIASWNFIRITASKKEKHMVLQKFREG